MLSVFQDEYHIIRIAAICQYIMLHSSTAEEEQKCIQLKARMFCPVPWASFQREKPAVPPEGNVQKASKQI